jgi:hypothetical protein
VTLPKLLGRTLTPTERVAVVKTAVLKTRPGKTHPEISSLHATWADEAAGVGWTADRLLRDAGVTTAAAAERAGHEPGVLPTDPGRPSPSLAHTLETVLPPTHEQNPNRSADVPLEGELLLAALQAAGQRRAVFSRADVAGQVAAHLPTDGLSAAQVLARVENLTDAALHLTEAVPVGQPVRGVTPRASDARYATVQVLSAEARILSLAERGRRGGYGHADPHVLLGAVRAARLDLGQFRAVRHLVGGGDFLTVLTAPAGAGKTSTLGTAAAAWQSAGYRVVGLAPSARAAAELGTATGTRTDTLAKWLHNQAHPWPLNKEERAWAHLDDRTVLIVDEASMASTLDLDRLTSAAAKAAAKVVLVGDPSQIGVINGPGGMLAALANAGHGVQLEQIHRFTQPWERTASLQLRAGNAGILATYQDQARLHACPDGDAALDAVFAHWSSARAAGQDALMLARTRTDVDALNTRARAAAVTAGQVTGPVTLAGDRPWQAGDLLRTRRNNRTLTPTHTTSDSPGQEIGQGSGHVRNGDRYLVLGAGPTGGLIVEDLTGRGRVVLPADYLAKHCEYGWASTIDSAQGATADLGLVLVRPGLDREHLYVAMTRGRHGNHAYITPDPTADPEHDHSHGNPHKLHPGGGRGAATEDHAVQVLTMALSQSGAQDAAHTALARARQVAADTARDTRSRAAGEAERQRRTPLPVPLEHQQAAQRLAELRAEREVLRERQQLLRTMIRTSKQGLTASSRWARGRRRDLASQLADSLRDLDGSHPELARLDQQIDPLARLVATQTPELQSAEAERQRPTGPDLPGLRPTSDLARPRATRSTGPRPAGVPSQPTLPVRRPWDDYDPHRDHPSHGRDHGGLSR